MRKWLIAFWNVITFPFRLIIWIIRGIKPAIAKSRQSYSNIRKFFTEEPEDSSLPDTFAKVVKQPVGIFEHLDALRKHLFRSIICMGLMAAIAAVFTPRLIDFLAKPIGGVSVLTAIEVTESIGVYMRVALMMGFAASLPYISFEFWLFIAPGIHPKSRVFSLIALPAVFILFILGVAFAYFVMLPTALPFLASILNIQTQWRVASYISFTTSVMFWIGLFFEFPIVIFVLAAIGLIKAKTLLNQWRLAIVIISIIAAMITPTVDPLSMSLVMGPMIILYALSTGLAFIAQRRHEA
jgi:sec-independent protein translocase protein TatC